MSQPTAPSKGPLLVIFLTVFIDLLGFGMVLPLLPIYGKMFSHDTTGKVPGLLLASFSAAQFLFAPIWGRLSDRYGRRPILMVGLAGSVFSYTAFGQAALAQSLFWLFVARIGAGICGATIPTAQAYIADMTTVENRTKGMALIGAAFGLGFTFGPLLGVAAVWSTDQAASPYPGYLAAALSAVALGLAVFMLPESLHAGSQRATGGWFNAAALSDALSIPSIGLLLLTGFVSLLSFSNFESTLSLFVTEPKGGFELSQTSLYFLYTYIGIVLSAVQGGLVRRLGGRVPDAVLAASGAGITIVGYVLLALSSELRLLWLMFVALTIEVIGFAFLPASLNALLSRRSDPRKQGGIFGINQSAQAMARIAGPVMGNRLFAASETSAAWPFVAAAALMLVALVMVVIAGRRGHDFQTSPEPSP
ncbi:MAG: MFS transporter [Pirellulales bacterium]|nr:MFS transporter [Pirellulales bacterium]